MTRVALPGGGDPPAAGAVSAGGPGGRGLRGGGVPALRRIPLPGAGQGRSGSAAGPDRLRRGGTAAAADGAVLRPLLCPGGLRAGPGDPAGQRGPGGQRDFLYRCGRPGPAGGRRSGVSGADSVLPGGGPPSCGGRPAGGPNLRGRAGGGAERLVGQWQRPPGAGAGPARVGAGPRRTGRDSAPAGPGAADAGAAAVSGGAGGTFAGGYAVPAAPTAALPRGGDDSGTAADRSDGLGGNLRHQAAGSRRGPGARRAGGRLRGVVGRRCEKGREIWTEDFCNGCWKSWG